MHISTGVGTVVARPRPSTEITIALGALALGTFGSGTAAFVIAGLLPQVARGLSVSTAQVGLLLTVFAVVYALSSPLLTSVAGQMRARAVLVLALGLFAAGNLAGAIAPDYTILVAGRVIAAAGAGLYVPAATALAARMVDPRFRGRALAIVIGGSSAANVVGVPLGIAIASTSSWRIPFAGLAAVSLVSLAAVLRLVPSLESLPPLSLAKRVGALRQPVLLTALLATLLWTVGGFTAYTYVAPLLAQQASLTPASIAVALLLFGIGSFAGNFLGGVAADRWGATVTCTTSLLVAAGLMLTLATVSTGLVLAGVWLLLWGTAAWTFFAPQQNRLISVMPSQPALALSLNLSALYLGIAGGSVLGALLVRAGHLTAVGLAGGLIAMLAAVMFAISVNLSRRQGRNA